ncbi:hypothetical protein D9M72_361330 [compost metagenome]
MRAHHAVSQRGPAGGLLPAFPVRGEEVQARHPAIGQLMQGADIARADVVELGVQELLGLRQREAQVALVQFQHQSLVAQAGQGQRHRGTGQQHKVKIGRGVVQQPLQGFVDTGAGQVVEVVQHQRHIALMGGNAVQQ